MKARRATKYWTPKEDKFIINSTLPLFLKGLYIGRSEQAIINRLRKLSKNK